MQQINNLKKEIQKAIAEDTQKQSSGLVTQTKKVSCVYIGEIVF